MTGPHVGMTHNGRMRLRPPIIAAALVAVLASIGCVGVAPAQADGTRIVTGWMPYWRTSPTNPQGITSAVSIADLASEVSPFWYSAVPGGPNGVTVRFNPGFTNAAANAAWSMQQLRAAGLTVLPAIADGSGKGRMAAVLADPAKRAGHVADLVALVVNGGYDGIDLDYEVFAFSDGRASWPATQPNWTAFVTELASALHAQGKLLSVTIPPPCNTAGACGGTNGYFVYNLPAIGQVADRVRIMTYDFHVGSAGPIAPLPWVTTVMTHAASVVPASKLSVGVPSYGRVWTQRSPSGTYQLSGTCPTSGSAYTQLTKSSSFTANDMPTQLAAAGVDLSTVQYDAASQESTVTFAKQVTWTDAGGAQQTCTAQRVAWWVGSQGALARTQLVGQLGLHSAAFWTIGGEDPQTWPAIRVYAQQLAPTPTSVTATVPPAAVFNAPTVLTATATAGGAPVVDATATLQFKGTGRKATWAPVASVQTDATGTASFTAQPTAAGSWRIIVAGAPGRAEQASEPSAIVVSSWVRMTAKATGARTTMRVVAQPATAGQVVLVQRKKGASWTTVGRSRANARGIAKVVVPTKPGVYRAVARPAGGIAQGVSEPVQLG